MKPRAFAKLIETEAPHLRFRKAYASDQLVYVDVTKFDAAWQQDKECYVGPGGEGGIEGRYERFGKFLNTGETIVVPEVYVDKAGQVSFTNGRHRFSVLRDKGCKVLPVAMPEDAVANARRAGLLIRGQ